MKEIISPFCEKNVSNKLTTFNEGVVVRQLLSRIGSEEIEKQEFIDNIKTIAAIIGKSWLHTHGQFADEPPAIIGIPRGGIPMAEGANTVLTRSPVFFTNAGKNRDPNKKLLPENLPTGIKHIIICDTVIGTGNTIAETISELETFSPTTNLSLFSTVASELGTKRLLHDFPNLNIYAAQIETDYELVYKDGKQVLFVKGIGDAGDMISKNNQVPNT